MDEVYISKMTKAQAKKWCVKKWQFFVDNPKCENYELREQIPELREFFCNCAYCSRYKDSIESDTPCSKCPLYKLEKVSCMDMRSPYDKWAKAKTLRSKKLWAKRILEDIKRS